MGVQGPQEDLTLHGKTHVVVMHTLQATSIVPSVDEVFAVREDHQIPQSKYWGIWVLRDYNDVGTFNRK